MSESQAESLALPKSEHERHLEAMDGLAADMLGLLGTDELRSIVWSDGERGYCLARADQWLSEQEQGQANWLHILHPNGEHDTLSLSASSDFAPTGEQRETVAGALRQQASAQLFGMVCQRLSAIDLPKLSVAYERTTVDFHNFTDAEHEPFVWIRVGELAFDLSESGLRRSTVHIRHPGVPEGEERQLSWLLHAAIAPGTGIPDRAWTRQAEYAQPRFNHPNEIGDYTATDFAHMVEIMECWSHDGVYVRSSEGRTLIRTIMDETYDTDEPGETAHTSMAVGIVFTRGGVQLETVSLPGGNFRGSFRIDMLGRNAAGMVIEHGRGEERRGEIAAARALHIMRELEKRFGIEGSLRLCDDETAQLLRDDFMREGIPLPGDESSVQ